MFPIGALRPLTLWDYGGALVVAPILVLVSYPILKRIARAEKDPAVLRFLLFVLLVKLAVVVVRYYMIAGIYGRGDAFKYDQQGIRIMALFRAGNYEPGLGSLVGTDFIRLVTGIVYSIIGPTIFGGFVVFAWLGFWGHLLWYRAFRLAVPEGASERYGRMVFFLPTLLLWPTSIGKEAWLTFAIGLAVYGLARMTTGRVFAGVLVMALGTWAVGMVRPHMATIIVVAGLLSALISKVRSRSAHSAPFKKILVAGTLVIGASFFVAQAATFFTVEGADTTSVTTVLEETQRRSDDGGSRFDSTIVDSPIDIPFATMSSLFRPFPWEVHNALAFATAAETLMLEALIITRFRGVLRALRLMRRRAFLAFSCIYVVGFGTAFAAVSNFGILARQRTLVLPAFLALLYVPPVRRMVHVPQPTRVASG